MSPKVTIGQLLRKSFWVSVKNTIQSFSVASKKSGLPTKWEKIDGAGCLLLKNQGSDYWTREKCVYFTQKKIASKRLM